MFDEVRMIKAFADVAFDRFDNAVKDLSEKEMDWQPIGELNSIRWILTHLSQQWNVGLNKISKGTAKDKPAGWPEDYVGNKSHTLEKLISDLSNGKNRFLSYIEGLNPADLEAEIPIWGGKRKLQTVLLLYLSEIFHHEGQIAYLKGAIKRIRESEDHFLT
ncbi:MAG: DinB family protein [Candidatus Bathyarchaeota archaeon]|nr:DinB family protein [Candidatus Bathyarchaeota archaeon]